MEPQVATTDPSTKKADNLHLNLQPAPLPIHAAEKEELIDVSAIPADFKRMVNRFTSDQAEQDQIFANAAEFFSLLPVLFD